jgi:hypothetical protein
MHFIDESIYWHGTDKTSSCINRILQEVPGCAPAISLTVFFCKVKIFPLLEELPPKDYSIFYNRMKVCIVN